MELISKKEASARGLKRYFTGVPCKNGHISERETKTGRCKGCDKASCQRHRQTEKGRLANNRRANRFNKKQGSTIKGIVRRAALGASYRAKAKGLEYALSGDDIDALLKRANGHCEITGIPFDVAHGQQLKRPFAPSLDRIDAAKGYTPDNVRLICVAMNVALSDWGEETFYILANCYLASKNLTRAA